MANGDRHISPETERVPRTDQAEPQPVPVDDPPGTLEDPPPHVVADAHGIGRASRLDRIARRAAQINETRGAGHERGLSDWLQAEREIDLTD